MPLIFKSNNGKGNALGIWRMDEPFSFFLENLNEKELFEDKLKSRQLERLGTRHLLNVLANRNIHHKVHYDSYGKPHLPDSSTFISFSHKRNHVAVIISNDNALTGIDIEELGNLPVKLAPKFISENDKVPDSVFSQQERATLIWSAKETLYKVYGKKELDFKQHLTVCFDKENRLNGFVNKGSYSQEIKLAYEFVDGLTLVHTL
ncbi:MAG: 4'-phosphopantetheinyl transferase superfamily protein [Bacteroidia bacterium]|nr:4'-phosphopantetheinyl transferase superfamily protein [Bacteroidia bacterium]